MFKEISPKEIKKNAVSLFDDTWALLTAGDKQSYNTMTVSWGSLGELWGRDTCTVYVRPQRYTYGFMEENDCFTLSFFSEEYKKALTFCGSKSGRTYDKAKETGLTVTETECGAAFEEAEMIICCKKLYSQDFKSDCFVDKSILSDCYAADDFHRFYVGEIVKVLVKTIKNN